MRVVLRAYPGNLTDGRVDPRVIAEQGDPYTFVPLRDDAVPLVTGSTWRKVFNRSVRPAGGLTLIRICLMHSFGAGNVNPRA